MTTASLRFGTVVWLQFNFTDQRGSKQAPVVVVSCERYQAEKPDLIAARITSRLHHKDTFGTVEVLDLQSAGLEKPSVVKPVLMTFLQRDVLRVAGELDSTTATNLRSALRTVLDL